MHLYAHCLRGAPGSVAVLAINNSQTQPMSIEVPVEAERYTLTARQLDSSAVQLNGQELRWAANGELPELRGQPIPAGRVELAPTSITFLMIPRARNENCR